MVLVMLWGVWQGIAALSAPESLARLRETLTLEAFLGGRTAAAVNHVMAHALPADYALRAAGGLLRWELFNAGGPQLRAGCDNWLFLTEELRPWPGAEAAMAERAAGLARVAAALRERGIALVVAVTPDKARVQQEALCGAPWSAQAQGRYAAFATLLRAQGVPPMDALGALEAGKGEGDVYWRTDTHWNQRGAALVAVAIAQAAATLPPPRDVAFRTELAAETTDGPGDLVRLMSLERLPAWLRPRPDRQRLARTTEAEAAGGDLLDDAPGPQVALLGSSYSVNANFHGELQQALGARVANFGKAGGGFAGSAQDYFASAAWRETPPKLVVWEVLERALAQPVGAEERAFLAAPLR
jgi:alginate O-acetyltransferase complex protein AlgJ